MSNHLNNAASSVLSAFNPIISIHENKQQQVEEGFLKPLLEDFFYLMGGIDNFCPLHTDKLKTEIDFETESNFVQAYLYKEIIDNIQRKSGSHLVDFKPKYVITFDKTLTPFEAGTTKYGTICLGKTPLLYYIYIDLQALIDFIKTL
jgi:hypothetical protein